LPYIKIGILQLINRAIIHIYFYIIHLKEKRDASVSTARNIKQHQKNLTFVPKYSIATIRALKSWTNHNSISKSIFDKNDDDAGLNIIDNIGDDYRLIAVIVKSVDI
jgi:hypothetical protein